MGRWEVGQLGSLATTLTTEAEKLGQQ